MITLITLANRANAITSTAQVFQTDAELAAHFAKSFDLQNFLVDGTSEEFWKKAMHAGGAKHQAYRLEAIEGIQNPIKMSSIEVSRAALEALGVDIPQKPFNFKVENPHNRWIEPKFNATPTRTQQIARLNEEIRRREYPVKSIEDNCPPHMSYSDFDPDFEEKSKALTSKQDELRALEIAFLKEDLAAAGYTLRDYEYYHSPVLEAYDNLIDALANQFELTGHEIDEPQLFVREKNITHVPDSLSKLLWKNGAVEGFRAARQAEGELLKLGRDWEAIKDYMTEKLSAVFEDSPSPMD